MIIRLNQIDILQNHAYNPNINYEFLLSRINYRLRQIENMKLLLCGNLSKEEYYKTVIDTYYISYKNQEVMRLNFLSNYNLTIDLLVRSDKRLPNKIFTVKEVFSYFHYNNMILERVNLSGYDEEYYNKNYNVKREDYIKVKEEELIGYYNYLYSSLNINNYNERIYNEMKKQLSKERIYNSLINLINYTNMELNYLNNSTNFKFDLVKQLC